MRGILWLVIVLCALPGIARGLGVTPTSLELQEGETKQVMVYNTAHHRIRLAFHTPQGFVINNTKEIGAHEHGRIMLLRTNRSESGMHTLAIYARPESSAQKGVITGGRVMINASEKDTLKASYAAARIPKQPEENSHASPFIGLIVTLCIIVLGICAYQVKDLFLANS